MAEFPWHQDDGRQLTWQMGHEDELCADRRHTRLLGRDSLADEGSPLKTRVTNYILTSIKA